VIAALPLEQAPGLLNEVAQLGVHARRIC
jgi:hypothetical protein